MPRVPRNARRRSSPVDPTPPGTPSSAGQVSDEEIPTPVVSDTLLGSSCIHSMTKLSVAYGLGFESFDIE